MNFLLRNPAGGEIILTGSYTPLFPDCGPTLQQFNCEQDLGYAALPGGVSYLSTVPASTATGSYSDLPGALSTPTAPVLTYSAAAVGLVLTATAASGGGGGENDVLATQTAESNESGVGASSMSTAASTAAGNMSNGQVRNGVSLWAFSTSVVIGF